MDVKNVKRGLRVVVRPEPLDSGGPWRGTVVGDPYDAHDKRQAPPEMRVGVLPDPETVGDRTVQHRVSYNRVDLMEPE